MSARAWPEDICARLQREFGDGAGDVQAELETLFSDPVVGWRTVRAVIHLAKGDRGELSAMIDAGTSDYRDVLFWAEHEDRDGLEPRRVRDMNEPFAEQEMHG